MAIVQLSRITNRRGLNQDLPLLAPGELGWCLDTRLLFIGNGTLEEGSPAIGNTEVLTEFSDIKRLVESITGPVSFTVSGIRILNDNQIVEADSGLSFPTAATSCILDYQIRRNQKTRIGTMLISFGGAIIDYTDNYVEPLDIGVNIYPKYITGLNKIYYTTTSTGFNAEFTASIRYFQ